MTMRVFPLLAVSCLLAPLLSAGIARASGVTDVAGRWSSSDCGRDWFDISAAGRTVVFNHNGRQTYRETLQNDTPDGFFTIETASPRSWQYRFIGPDRMQVSSSSAPRITEYHRCRPAGRDEASAAQAGPTDAAVPLRRAPLSEPPTATAGPGTAPLSPAPSPAAASVASLLRAPRLTPLVASLMYQKINGDPPDFQTYAERSAAAQSANAFDRVDATHREIRRLQELFERMNPDDSYTLSIADSLQPYDPARSGFPLSFSDARYIQLTDPGRNVVYALQFDNIDDFNLIRTTDVQAAREFALRHRLGAGGSGATFDVAFHFVRSAPPPGGSFTPLLAHIDAARIVGVNGDILAEFGPKQDAAPPQKVSADVQGVQIGMTYDEANAAASARFTTARRDEKYKSSAFYFDDYSNPHDWSQCGQAQFGMEGWELSAINEGSPSGQKYSACLGFKMDSMWNRTAPPGTPNYVHEIYADQKLSGTTAAEVKASLVKKYGRPTTTASESNSARVADQYTWTLPLDGSGRSAVIEATLTSDIRGKPGDLDLLIHEIPYVDPHPKTTEPHITGGPRL